MSPRAIRDAVVRLEEWLEIFARYPFGKSELPNQKGWPMRRDQATRFQSVLSQRVLIVSPINSQQHAGRVWPREAGPSYAETEQTATNSARVKRATKTLTA